MTFAGYWAKNYYMNMHNYSKEYALSISEAYWISFLISALLVGTYTTTINQVKKYIVSLSLLGVIAYSIMLIPILFSYPTLILITTICGVSSSGIILSFFLIQHTVAEDCKGLGISLNNLFVVLGGMIGQILFSQIITFNFNKICLLSCKIDTYFYSGLFMLVSWSFLALIATIFAVRKI